MVGARYNLTMKQVWALPNVIWQAMILLWNKEQDKAKDDGKPKGQRVLLVQDPDDKGD